MKKSIHKTNYDSFANLVKIEKEECAADLSETRVKLDELNTEMREVIEKIIAHEFKVRDVADVNGHEINLTEYNLIRLNINELSVKKDELRDNEEALKSVHDMQFHKFSNKQKLLDKLLEKQAKSRCEIEASIKDKEEMEMDDSWCQTSWVKKNV